MNESGHLSVSLGCRWFACLCNLCTCLYISASAISKGKKWARINRTNFQLSCGECVYGCSFPTVLPFTCLKWCEFYFLSFPSHPPVCVHCHYILLHTQRTQHCSKLDNVEMVVRGSAYTILSYRFGIRFWHKSQVENQTKMKYVRFCRCGRCFRENSLDWPNKRRTKKKKKMNIWQKSYETPIFLILIQSMVAEVKWVKSRSKK